jgi:microcystin-dependent protein
VATFALPNLRARVPVGINDVAETGPPVLSARQLADTGGEEAHKLATEEMPKHFHRGLNGVESFVTDRSTVAIASGSGQTLPTGRNSGTGDAGGDATHVVLAHENMPLFVVLDFLIKFVW